MKDAQLIDQIGGPAPVARLLKFNDPVGAGARRVSNWRIRGIPWQVRAVHGKTLEKAAQKARQAAEAKAAKANQAPADATT